MIWSIIIPSPEPETDDEMRPSEIVNVQTCFRYGEAMQIFIFLGTNSYIDFDR